MIKKTVIAFSLILSPCVLFADGGMFTVTEYFASDIKSPNQLSVLTYRNGKESLVLHTGYSGDAAGFAWVIPVPSAVAQADVTTVDSSIFDTLYYWTEPIFYKSTRIDSCGPSCGGASAAGGDGLYAGVTVENSFSVSGYDIVVLSATDSSNLTLWLQTNGYRVTAEQSSIVQKYVDASFRFVAVKASVPASSSSVRTVKAEGPAPAPSPLPPLKIVFSAPEPVYPMTISQVSSPEVNDILLYVFADKPYLPKTYPWIKMDLSDVAADDAFASNYQSSFKRRIAQYNGRVFVLEYAEKNPWWGSSSLSSLTAEPLSDGDEMWLIRMRGLFPKATLDQDLSFAPDDTLEEFYLFIDVVEADVSFLLILAGLGMRAVWRRRRM
jgi:hypothetical protein